MVRTATVPAAGRAELILYLDTSSLLKRYIRDETSAALDAWMVRAEVAATSQVSLAEAAAALRATPRWAGATRGELGRALEALVAEWDDYVVVGIDERLAADLAWRHGLTGFGAFHIAGALTAARLASPDPLTFSSLDGGLRRAARAESLSTVDWAG